jgi:hypothetical protein
MAQNPPRQQDGNKAALTDEQNVVPLPTPPAEEPEKVELVPPLTEADKKLQVKVEHAAEHLASQAEWERNFWMKKRADELGVEVPRLRQAIDGKVKEKKAAADAKAKEVADIEKRAAAKRKQEDDEAADKAKAEAKLELESAKRAEQEQKKAERQGEAKRFRHHPEAAVGTPRFRTGQVGQAPG